jgi:hypothetical protein
VMVNVNVFGALVIVGIFRQCHSSHIVSYNVGSAFVVDTNL